MPSELSPNPIVGSLAEDGEGEKIGSIGQKKGAEFFP
jgi:hypothetical protein